MSGFGVAIVVMAAVSLGTATQFASTLRKCRVNDNVALNLCLRQTFEDIRPSLRTGIPELSLPPLEPMSLQRIVFRQGDGGVISVSSTFNNVIVSGLSNFTTTYIDANPNSRTLRIGLRIPSLRVTGLYHLTGQFFFLPAEGKGDFWANFDGVDASGTSRINIITGADGQERLRVSQTNIDFTIRDLSIHLNNLFNGDELLGPATNLFLNDNGQEILRDLKPEVMRLLNELVQKVMNDAFSQLPVSSFIQTN